MHFLNVHQNCNIYRLVRTSMFFYFSQRRMGVAVWIVIFFADLQTHFPRKSLETLTDSSTIVSTFKCLPTEVAVTMTADMLQH